jgi:hypothetical protein
MVNVILNDGRQKCFFPKNGNKIMIFTFLTIVRKEKVKKGILIEKRIKLSVSIGMIICKENSVSFIKIISHNNIENVDVWKSIVISYNIN